MFQQINKSNVEIAHEWDAIAHERFRQISSGNDKTYTDVLCPLFVYEVSKLRRDGRILDAGCGLGFLSHALSKVSREVVGVDISEESLSIARKKNSAKNVKYHFGDISEIALGKFDICVANMFLMDCLDLQGCIAGIRSSLGDGGRLLITIPNPMIMPRYWGYENKSWFNYAREIVVEAEFRTSSGGMLNFSTTHVHRPISSYISLLLKNGFILDDFREVTGRVFLNRRISKYPRHLFISLRVGSE